jgi:PEP-CTERM motif-containing protein
MWNTLRGMALVVYGLLVSTQFAFAGVNPVISVPEPGTLALMAAGVGALAFVRFRKRK